MEVQVVLDITLLTMSQNLSKSVWEVPEQPQISPEQFCTSVVVAVEVLTTAEVTATVASVAVAVALSIMLVHIRTGPVQVTEETVVVNLSTQDSPHLASEMAAMAAPTPVVVMVAVITVLPVAPEWSSSVIDFFQAFVSVFQRFKSF